MQPEDVKKMKVAELREALKLHGLDTKGNKPFLVKRLENYLRKSLTGENGEESLNESLNASQDECNVSSQEESIAEDQSEIGGSLSESKESDIIQELPKTQEAEPEPEPEVQHTTPTTEAVMEQAEQQVPAAEKPAPAAELAPPAANMEPEAVEAEEPVAVDEPVTKTAFDEQPSDVAAIDESHQPVTEPEAVESVEQMQQEAEPAVDAVATDQADKPEPTDVEMTTDEPESAKSEIEPVKSETEPVTCETVPVKSETEPAKEETQSEDKPKVEVIDLDEVKSDEAKEDTVKMETDTDAKDAAVAGDAKEAADDGASGEVFKVMDSVGEVDAVIPVVDNNDERSSRKRPRSRSRSRSPHRRHRSRSPRRRSRSPRRRSRSSDRHRRSGSKERHRQRSGSRDRYGRDRGRESYVMRRDIEEPDDWIEATNVQFDKFNCDLHIRVREDGYKCTPITVEGFAFMWAGVRANYGVRTGKVAYECKILEHLNVDHLPDEERTRHVVRVGFSTDECSMQLGEEKLSFGYGGTGKASTECEFKDYGEKFAEGDVIGVYLDLDAEPATIAYSKNGVDLGTCFEFEKSTLGEQALYPHVLSKNCEFTVNFGQMEAPWFPLKEGGYAFINDVPEAERVRGTKPPAKKEDCEMIMMCGLPGAGKTYWASKYAAEHFDQRYNVLGTNNIIDKMKVMGLPRKGNYSGRWDVLIDKSTKCLTRLMEIASKKKRNFILDQTNVYPNAQRRKMRPFEGFKRRAIVIVPSDEVFKERCEKRERTEGKEIPDNAVWEMKANFQLPEVGPCFDTVEFVELERDEAQKLVEQYNKEGHANLPPDYKRFRGPDRYADRDRSRGYGGGGGGGGGGRYDNRDRYYPDYRQQHGSRGSYMGYSSSDRQRVDRYSDRDRDRSYRDSRSSGGRSYSSGYGSGGGGYHNSYSSGGGWGSQSHSGGGWGSQGQSGGWGSQGWGSQGGSSGGSGSWGQQQGYGSGNQWSGYGQQSQSSSQGWGNQGYYGNWGSYYGSGQQGGSWGSGGGYSGGGGH